MIQEKLIYVTPEIDEVDFQVESAILGGSSTGTTDPIGDDPDLN